MIAAPFLSLLLQAISPSAPPAPGPAQAQLPAEAFPTLFLFFRLRYFHYVAVLRRCRRVDAGRMAALDARYHALHRQIIARFDAATIEAPGRDPPERGEDADCGTGITFLGYANALDQLERHLAETAR